MPPPRHFYYVAQSTGTQTRSRSRQILPGAGASSNVHNSASLLSRVWIMQPKERAGPGGLDFFFQQIFKGQGLKGTHTGQGHTYGPGALTPL